MNQESLREEIENLGKIIQRNLATRVIGFDDPNCLAMTIRDEENVRVNDKCTRYGFSTFKELLEAPEMSKFVEVNMIKDGAKIKTIYKAKRDGTTRNVMEQQKWFYETEGRQKEQRRQHFQVLSNATTKRRCSMMPLSSVHNQQPFLCQMQPPKPFEKGNLVHGVSLRSGESKWKLNLSTTTASNDVITSKSVVAPPKQCHSSPSSPVKKQSLLSKVFSNQGWKRLELPFGKDSVLRCDGICAEYPEYNVDFVTDPRRSRHHCAPSPLTKELLIPEFFVNFALSNGENCDLINLHDKNNDAEVFCSNSVVSAAVGGGANSAGIFTEEKMRHLGAIATSLCKYHYKFRGSTPIKFDLLHKMLSEWEPLFNRLMKDSQQLVDFFTLFCPKLELVYPPPKHELDKFHLYFNEANE